MTMQLYTSQNQPITLTDVLGKGGEATVYHVAKYPAMVGKLYHQPTPSHEAKLRAMIARPPEQPATHIAIAWPTELLYQQGRFVGFLMPKVTQHQPIFEVYNPTKRAKMFPQFTLFHLLRTASNLAAATHAVHRAGHVVGDMNESNLLVNAETLITLVDTDSFQIMTPDHQVYRCGVGKAEYTPPELQKMNFKDITRRVEHDNFGLAVLIFQLLMQGFHPFAGTLLSEQSVGRVDLYAIQQGIFPYSETQAMKPPRGAPNFAHLPPHIQLLFERCFVTGYSKPLQRPDAAEWARALYQAESAIITCRRDSHHLYFNHLTQCPYCIPPKPIMVAPSLPMTTPETPLALAPLAPRSAFVSVVLALWAGVALFIWGTAFLGGSIFPLIAAFIFAMIVGGFIQFCPDNLYHYLIMSPEFVTIHSNLSLQELQERLWGLLTKKPEEGWFASLFSPSPTVYKGNLDKNNNLTMTITHGSGRNKYILQIEGILDSAKYGSKINLRVGYDVYNLFGLLIVVLFAFIHPCALGITAIAIPFMHYRISSAMRELSKALDGKIVDTKKLGQGNGLLKP